MGSMEYMEMFIILKMKSRHSLEMKILALQMELIMVMDGVMDIWITLKTVSMAEIAVAKMQIMIGANQDAITLIWIVSANVELDHPNFFVAIRILQIVFE